MKRIVTIIAVILALGCNGSDGDDSTDTDTSDTDTNDTDTDTNDTDTDDTDNDTDTYENTGLCGYSGQAVANSDSYQGTEEIYLVADKGDGEDVCRIRVDLNSIGAPEVPCEDCEWAFVLEKSNVQVIADVNDGCASSYLQLDDDDISALEGQQVSYGYVAEYLGHIAVLMRFDEDSNLWSAIGYADWDSDTFDLTYDMQDGWCGY